jgi:hypothetical protein
MMVCVGLDFFQIIYIIEKGFILMIERSLKSKIKYVKIDTRYTFKN